MEYSKEKLLMCAENGIYYKHHDSCIKTWFSIYHLNPDDLLIDLTNERLICLSEWENEDGYGCDPAHYVYDEFKLEDYGKEWSMNKEDLL